MSILSYPLVILFNFVIRSVLFIDKSDKQILLDLSVVYSQTNFLISNSTHISFNAAQISTKHLNYLSSMLRLRTMLSIATIPLLSSTFNSNPGNVTCFIAVSNNFRIPIAEQRYYWRISCNWGEGNYRFSEMYDSVQCVKQSRIQCSPIWDIRMNQLELYTVYIL